MYWYNFGRRFDITRVRHRFARLVNVRFNSSATDASKKLYLRNVFKDNPSAKYYFLATLCVTASAAYYIYSNQQRKKFVLNVLPAAPNHEIVPYVEDLEILNSILHRNNEVKIVGLPGSGRTQLARLFAGNLTETRNESFRFKLWPKDEVTATLNALNKESLLESYKQLASKLGCDFENMQFADVTFDEKLKKFSEAIKEKLKKKLYWILLVENLDERLPIKEWLPDQDWGNGYIIYTSHAENDVNSSPVCFHMKRMTLKSARHAFIGIVGKSNDRAGNVKDAPEHLFSLLLYNPLSIACAAMYFKHQIQLNKNFNYEDLYADINEAVKNLKEINSDSTDLEIVQASSIALATRAIVKCYPVLLHVFDFIASCSKNKPIPMAIFSHHLKIPEYHLQTQMKPNLATVKSNEEVSTTVQENEEQKSNILSFRGFVNRAISMFERIKLEIDAIKSLFGYNNSASLEPSQSMSDGLDFIRSCPLLKVTHEPLSGVEVVTVHPGIHKVLRHVFLYVTVPELEKQHLLLAERKHCMSYFARLRSFNAQRSISEYRKNLGDYTFAEFRDAGLQDPTESFYVGGILHPGSKNDSLDPTHVFAHRQEHLCRVVNSFDEQYRISGGYDNSSVARVLLLPHLVVLLQEKSLTAKSKAQIYRIMANIHFQVLNDCARATELLKKSYAVIEQRYGADSIEAAEILTEQAELCLTAEELMESKAMLERVIAIHQKHIKTSQKNVRPFQYGKALIALGVTCGGLGENARSKELLEKGLMELQTASPNNPMAKESKWFAAEISSAVTNLGHAYLFLGKIGQGRKLLELALIGHQNVHGDIHHEVMRTLNTLSIAHAMQGNSHESKRLRNEAGKIKKKLDTRAPLYLS